MKTAGLVYALVLGLVLVGCATIISGTSQIITVNANVEGAEVHLVTDAGDQLLGPTPLSRRVKRGQEGTLRVTAEGYQPYESALNKKINTVFFVNILSGGTFGSTTDYLSGAMYAYEPSTYMVILQPANLSDVEKQEWQRREALRGFVLMNGEALVSDLGAGEGEYLDVLIDALDVAPENRVEAIGRWRDNYVSAFTALEFAERMIAELDR